MIAKRLIPAAAATLLALALSAAAGEKAPPPAPAPAPAPGTLRVAAVDVEKVLNEYKKGTDLYKEIEKELEPRANNIKQKAKYIREEQQRLASDPRADPIEQLQRKQKIELAIAEVNKEEKDFNERRTELEVKAMDDVWSDVNEAAARYAREHGLDLVIKQQVRSGKARSATTIHMRIAAQTLLYVSPRLDITDELLKQLNAEYERGHGRETKDPAPKG